MAQGYKDFTAGAILTAADLEDYNQNQSIMRFASAAARDSALTTVKTEGMLAYLIDVNTLTVYNGSAWSTIGPVHGAWTAYTPTITQSGTVTHTITKSNYYRDGRKITYQFLLNITGTGSASNVVTVSLPVTALNTSDIFPLGTFLIYDASVTTAYQAWAVPTTSTTIKGLSSNSLTFLGAAAAPFAAALASGDAVCGTIVYEAAADA